MDQRSDISRKNTDDRVINDITRFRKKYGIFDKDASATDNEFKNAVNLGVDNNLDNVPIRDIKDNFNAMTNWVKYNSAEIDKLAEYEKNQLMRHQRETSNYYHNYKGAEYIYRVGLSDAAAQFRRAFKSYALYAHLTIIPRLEVRQLDE